MFGLDWSEIALVAVVALILIGPKDLPVAIRAITNLIKKARRMAGEFQTHVDDMVRDTDMSEMRGTLNELRGMDLRGTVRRAIDPGGTIAGALHPGGFAPPPPASFVGAAPAYEAPGYDAAVAVAERPYHAFARLPEPYDDDGRPAFIPPQLRDPATRPAFIPPGVRAP